MTYKEKYLEYKAKYLALKNQIGGMNTDLEIQKIDEEIRFLNRLLKTQHQIHGAFRFNNPPERLINENYSAIEYLNKQINIFEAKKKSLIQRKEERQERQRRQERQAEEEFRRLEREAEPEVLRVGKEKLDKLRARNKLDRKLDRHRMEYADLAKVQARESFDSRKQKQLRERLQRQAEERAIQDDMIRRLTEYKSSRM